MGRAALIALLLAGYFAYLRIEQHTPVLSALGVDVSLHLSDPQVLRPVFG